MPFARHEQREGPVDVAGSETSNQRIVGSLDHRERETGAVPGKTLDCARQEARERRRHANPSVSLDSISERLQLVESLLPASKNESRVSLEERAVDRGRDALAAAGKELDSQ